jgi:hypothetical protein
MNSGGTILIGGPYMRRGAKTYTKFELAVSPLTPDDIFIQPWRADESDGEKIIGTWAEDGSPYEIKCPPQLRGRLIALQNVLPQLVEFVRVMAAERLSVIDESQMPLEDEDDPTGE